MTEGEMVGWHHQLDGHEFEWAQHRLLAMDRRAAVYGVAGSDMTEWLNWTELILHRKSLGNNLTVYSSQDSNFSLSITSAINHQEFTSMDYIISVSYRKFFTGLRFNVTRKPVLLLFKTYPKEIIQVFTCIYLVISLLCSRKLQKLA